MSHVALKSWVIYKKWSCDLLSKIIFNVLSANNSIGHLLIFLKAKTWKLSFVRFRLTKGFVSQSLKLFTFSKPRPTFRIVLLSGPPGIWMTPRIKYRTVEKFACLLSSERRKARKEELRNRISLARCLLSQTNEF